MEGITHLSGINYLGSKVHSNYSCSFGISSSKVSKLFPPEARFWRLNKMCGGTGTRLDVLKTHVMGGTLLRKSFPSSNHEGTLTKSLDFDIGVFECVGCND